MLLDNFAVDLVAISRWTQKKRSLGVWSAFTPLLTHLASLKDFLPLSNPKKGVCRRNNNPLEFKGGEYLQREAHQGFRVVYKAVKYACDECLYAPCLLLFLMYLCRPETQKCSVTTCFLLACSVQTQPPIGPFRV